MGGDYRRLEREIHRGLANACSLNFVGPDKIAGTADDVATAYLDGPLAHKPFALGQPAYPWIDRVLVNDTYQQHPEYFTKDLAAEHRTRVTAEKSLDEAVTSGYARFDAKLFENRLNLTTGARWERTAVSRAGNLVDPTLRYQRDANGRCEHRAVGTLSSSVIRICLAHRRPGGNAPCFRVAKFRRTMAHFASWNPSRSPRYSVAAPSRTP